MDKPKFQVYNSQMKHYVLMEPGHCLDHSKDPFPGVPIKGKTPPENESDTTDTKTEPVNTDSPGLQTPPSDPPAPGDSLAPPPDQDPPADGDQDSSWFY